PAMRSTPFPYTTLFRSVQGGGHHWAAGTRSLMPQEFVTLDKLMEILEAQDKTANTTPDISPMLSGTATEPTVNPGFLPEHYDELDRKSTRLNSSHGSTS